MTEPTPTDSAQLVVDDELVDAVADLVEAGHRGLVLNLVADLRGADVASLLQHLPPDLARVAFRWLPEEITSRALPELESAERIDLLDGLSTADLVALIDPLATDDQADVLADVDVTQADDVLVRLEDASDVEALLSYGEDTAGGLMATEVVAVPTAATVAEATEAVRQQAEAVDPVFSVYAVDDEGRLVGVVSLKRLLLSRADRPVAEIAETDVVSVEPDLDQEEVARIMERYDLVALPVVSAGGRLLGRITIDDIVDVIRDEAEEDLQRAVGITGEEELSSSVFAISRGRLIWLLLGLVGAYVSGLVIVGFEDALQVAPVLALFIPIVMAMAGNAGIQSSAIAVQGLASGDLWRGDLVAADRQGAGGRAHQRRRAGGRAGRHRHRLRLRRQHRPVGADGGARAPDRDRALDADRGDGAARAQPRRHRPGARDGAVHHGLERHPGLDDLLRHRDAALSVRFRVRALAGPGRMDPGVLRVPKAGPNLKCSVGANPEP